MNPQRTRTVLAAMAAAIAVLVATAGASYWLGAQQAQDAAPGGAAPAASVPAPVSVPQTMAEGEEATRRHMRQGIKAGDVDPGAGRRVLYYHDPMVPGNKFDKPGKSPFMDMMLVPMYAGEDQDQGRISVSPRIQQNLGIRTAVATEGVLAPRLSAVGAVAFNERDQAVVQARATAFVERLHVRATLDRVRRGQVLAELHIPAWIAVQEEFLVLRRMQGSNLEPLIEGARVRMLQAGMSNEQIRAVEAAGRANPRIAVTAPLDGLVTEIGAREGMAVMQGTTLFRINGFSSVWANAEVPESQAALLRPGTRVRAQTPSAPGVHFDGQVQALLPNVDAATRTLKARVELANAGGRLVPGMFVSMEFMDPRQQRAVLVPTEAVMRTGRRTVVMLAEENGRFRPVEVVAGIESGDQTEISSGLQPGQRVVVSSQFLIDSEASLRGLMASPGAGAGAAAAAASAPAAPPRYQSEARVEAVDKETMTLTHGPIPELKWPTMTMDFKLPPAGQLPPKLRVGDRVSFEFQMEKDGLPQLTRVSRLAGTVPVSAPAPGNRQ